MASSIKTPEDIAGMNSAEKPIPVVTVRRPDPDVQALEETIDLALKTDGRALVSPQALQFYFEIDSP